MEKEEQTVQRGSEARQILQSQVFIDAFKSLADKYVYDFINSAEPDSQLRERIYIKAKVLEELRYELGIVEQRGVKAEVDIKNRRHRAAQK